MRDIYLTLKIFSDTIIDTIMNDVLMDENFIEELRQLIGQASIAEEDKGLWLDALKNAAPEVLMSILSYFQAFPDKIGWATDLLKRKVQALKTKDENTWNQILTEEEAALTNIVNEQ